MEVYELMEVLKTKDSLKNKGYKHCKPINGSKKSIYEMAADLSKQCEEKFQKLDLFDIVEYFGGKIHTLAFKNWGNLSGSILIHKKNNFDIILPEHTSPIRDKFTLAHELGHYLLHSNEWKEKLWAARKDSDRLEWEANWFAAGFLMPADKIEERIAEPQKNDFFETAAIFGVSTEAAEYRLKTYNDFEY